MKITALDENGKPVDWWFIYKVPQLNAGSGIDGATGYEYVYYDATIDKKKGREQAVEKLVEFVGEFTHLSRLAVVYNESDDGAQGRLMVQRVREVFPGCPVTTAHLGASVASIFGPRTTGLIIFDVPGAEGMRAGGEAEA